MSSELNTKNQSHCKPRRRIVTASTFDSTCDPLFVSGLFACHSITFVIRRTPKFSVAIPVQYRRLSMTVPTSASWHSDSTQSSTSSRRSKYNIREGDTGDVLVYQYGQGCEVLPVKDLCEKLDKGSVTPPCGEGVGC